ncbi:CapA family protein [Bacillus sp. Marseille-Q3570]|uniref:CapA family protein n=1 Tax=Bacillus sp. Marseille-Q3570 TaxID=2963522 RepID=UPI0021B73D04|nr:CapA family protein [Bacillus sp. Marseille-Q3570]
MKVFFGLCVSLVLLLTSCSLHSVAPIEVEVDPPTKRQSQKQTNDKSTNQPTTKISEKSIKTAEAIVNPITISFTGDILLDSRVGAAIDQHGVDYPYQSVKHILQKSDITIGNLETSVSTRGTPEEKLFAFRSKPETLKGLADAGYDMVSIANNHTLDYGTEALFDTMDHLKNYGIGYSGAGKNEEEAFTAYYKTVNGKKVAILGLSRVLPYADWAAQPNRPGIASAYTYEPMMKYVKKAVENSDHAIVYIHWNKERADYPEDYAREMARKFIDAGVSAIIGSHSHSLMGIEYYDGAPIFYSLGNFVFTQSKSPKGQETMIVNLSFDDDEVKPHIIPAKIINYQPTLMDDAYNQSIINKLNQLSYNARIDQNGKVESEE